MTKNQDGENESERRRSPGRPDTVASAGSRTSGQTTESKLRTVLLRIRALLPELEREIRGRDEERLTLTNGEWRSDFPLPQRTRFSASAETSRLGTLSLNRNGTFDVIPAATGRAGDLLWIIRSVTRGILDARLPLVDFELGKFDDVGQGTPLLFRLPKADPEAWIRHIRAEARHKIETPMLSERAPPPPADDMSATPIAIDGRGSAHETIAFRAWLSELPGKQADAILKAAAGWTVGEHSPMLIRNDPFVQIALRLDSAGKRLVPLIAMLRLP